MGKTHRNASYWWENKFKYGDPMYPHDTDYFDVMIRNKIMLEQEPDIVIAFPGGAGTENMITISRQAGVPVFIV